MQSDLDLDLADYRCVWELHNELRSLEASRRWSLSGFTHDLQDLGELLCSYLDRVSQLIIPSTPCDEVWSFDPTKLLGFVCPSVEDIEVELLSRPPGEVAKRTLGVFGFLGCSALDEVFRGHLSQLTERLTEKHAEKHADKLGEYIQILREAARRCPRVATGQLRLPESDTLPCVSNTVWGGLLGVFCPLDTQSDTQNEARSAEEEEKAHSTTCVRSSQSELVGYCCNMQSGLLWVCDPETHTVWVPSATEYCSAQTLPAQLVEQHPLLGYLSRIESMPSPNQVRKLSQDPNLYGVLPKIGGVALQEYWGKVHKHPRPLHEQVLDCVLQLHHTQTQGVPDLHSCAEALRAQLEVIVPRVDLPCESWCRLVAYKEYARELLLEKTDKLTAKQEKALRATSNLLMYAEGYRGSNPLVLWRRLGLWAGCLFLLLRSADDFVPAAIQGLLQHSVHPEFSQEKIEQPGDLWVRRVLWCADCAQAVYNTTNLSTTAPVILAEWLGYTCKLAKLKKIPGDTEQWQIEEFEIPPKDKLK